MAKSKKPDPSYAGWKNMHQVEWRKEAREEGKPFTKSMEIKYPDNKSIRNTPVNPIPKLSKLEQEVQNLGGVIYDRLQEKYKKKAKGAN